MATRFKRQFLLVVSLLTALVLFSAIPHAHAASSGRLISQTKEQIDENTYIITALYDTTTARSSKTGSKSISYYHDGKTAWTLTVYGEFASSGSAYFCVGDSVTYSTSGLWSCTSARSSHSSTTATAYGTFTAIGVQTVSDSVSISCDSKGNLT